MARFTIILAVVFLVLLQDVLVTGWLWRRRRRTCRYPRPSQGSNYGTYFLKLYLSLQFFLLFLSLNKNVKS